MLITGYQIDNCSVASVTLMPAKTTGLFDVEMTLYNEDESIAISGCVTAHRALNDGWSLQARSYTNLGNPTSDLARKKIRRLMNDVVRNLETEIKQCIS